MTSAQIEAMAREADPDFGNSYDDMPNALCGMLAITRFAALVRAQALEDAARIPAAAAARLLAQKRAPEVDRHCAYILELHAAAIRALAPTPKPPGAPAVSAD